MRWRIIAGEDADRKGRFREYLLGIYAENATLPIGRPNAAGAFPNSLLEEFAGEPLVVVPDTMVFRNDVNHACATGRRGSLLTAANTGALRIVCAEHVVREVQEQLRQWAERKKLPYDGYANVWNEEYLPLIRIVPAGGISLDILSSAERARVEALGRSKDVPSVIAALTLGALYLTLDSAAWSAAYGREPAAGELYDWLPWVKDGGEAGELSKILFGLAAVPTLAAIAIGSATSWLAKRSPLALGIGAVLLAGLAARIPVETYRSIGSVALEAAVFVAEEVLRPQREARARFEKRCAPTPVWSGLLGDVPRRALLARACAHTLVRAQGSQMSAAGLARVLPTLGVGQSAQLVRETLRGGWCFREIYRGWWQVGRAFGAEDLAR